MNVFDEKRAELEQHEFMMGLERAGWRWRSLIDGFADPGGTARGLLHVQP